MSESNAGKILSKQRRRRRILMNDGDEDDGTPSKIENIIHSENGSESSGEFEKEEVPFSGFGNQREKYETINKRVTNIETSESRDSTFSYLNKSETTFTNTGVIDENIVPSAKFAPVDNSSQVITAEKSTDILIQFGKPQLSHDGTVKDVDSLTADENSSEIVSYKRELTSYSYSVTESTYAKYSSTAQYVTIGNDDKKLVSDETEPSAISLDRKRLTKAYHGNVVYEAQSRQGSVVQPMNTDLVHDTQPTGGGVEQAKLDTAQEIHPVEAHKAHKLPRTPEDLVENEEQMMHVDGETKVESMEDTMLQEESDSVHDLHQLKPEMVLEIQPGNKTEAELQSVHEQMPKQNDMVNELQAIRTDTGDQEHHFDEATMMQNVIQTMPINTENEMQLTQRDQLNPTTVEMTTELQPSHAGMADGIQAMSIKLTYEVTKSDGEYLENNMTKSAVSKRMEFANTVQSTLVNKSGEGKSVESNLELESNKSGVVRKNFSELKNSSDTLVDSTNHNLLEAMEYHSTPLATDREYNDTSPKSMEENELSFWKPVDTETSVPENKVHGIKDKVLNEIPVEDSCDITEHKAAQHDIIPESSCKNAKRKHSDDEDNELETQLEPNARNVSHVSVKRKVRLSTYHQQSRAQYRKLHERNKRNTRDSKTVFNTSVAYIENTRNHNKNLESLTQDIHDKRTNTNGLTENILATRQEVLDSSKLHNDNAFGVISSETTNSGELPTQKLSTTTAKSCDHSPYTVIKKNQGREQEAPKNSNKYRVQCYLEMSPVQIPESGKLFRKWKSEPNLKVTRSRTRRSKSLNLEKNFVQKQSSLTIHLKKPAPRSLAPAYSVDDLPFQTIIRNEVNFKLNAKRRKSYPLPSYGKSVCPTEDDYLVRRDLDKVQTPILERSRIQPSEAYEALETFYADMDQDENDNDYGKENYDVNLSLSTTLNQRNIKETSMDKQKGPRKSHLRVTPVTVRPKRYKEKPTHVVVKQQCTSDVTFGRIESTNNYKVVHAVTSGTPRNDIVIEEMSPLQHPIINQGAVNQGLRADKTDYSATQHYTKPEENKVLLTFGELNKATEDQDYTIPKPRAISSPKQRAKSSHDDGVQMTSALFKVREATGNEETRFNEGRNGSHAIHYFDQQKQPGELQELRAVASKETEIKENQEPRLLELREGQHSPEDQIKTASFKTLEVVGNEKYKKPIKRRHKALVETEKPKAVVEMEKTSLSSSSHYPSLNEEQIDESEQPKQERKILDIERYLSSDTEELQTELHHENNAERWTTYTTKEQQSYPKAVGKVEKTLEDTNEEIPADTTDGLVIDQHTYNQPLNIHSYLESVVERKKDHEKKHLTEQNAEPYEQYFANKDIQILMEKMSEDGEVEELVQSPPVQQEIEVILVDETKKKRRKAKMKQEKKPLINEIEDKTPAKTGEAKIDASKMEVEPPVFLEQRPKSYFLSTVTHENNVEEPVKVNDEANIWYPEKIVEPKKQEPTKVAGKSSSRVDEKLRSKTKEQAVQTIFEYTDVDTDDSDQEISEFSQRTGWHNFLINTISKEEKGEEDDMEEANSEEDDDSEEGDGEEEEEKEKGEEEGEAAVDGKQEHKYNVSDTSTSKRDIRLQEYLQHKVRHIQSPTLDNKFKPVNSQEPKSTDESQKLHSNAGKTLPGLMEGESEASTTAFSTRNYLQDLLSEGQRQRTENDLIPPPIKKKRKLEHNLEQTKPIKIFQPEHKICDFVFDKKPQTKEPLELSPVKELMKSKVSSVKEQERIDPTYQPRYQLQNFLLEEQKSRQEPQLPSADENLGKETGTLVVIEPETIKSNYQPKLDIPHFILKEQSLRTEPEKPAPLDKLEESENPSPDKKPSKQKRPQRSPPTKTPKTAAVHVAQELKPIKQPHQPRYEIKDFLLEVQTDKKQPDQTTPVETLKSSAVPLVEEEPKSIKPTYQPRYEIKEFVFQEQPDKKKPEQPKPVDAEKKSLVPSVEEEPQPIRQAYQPRYEIKDFVLEEQQDKKLPEGPTPAETEKKSKVPLSEEEPQPNKSTYQPTYEIQDLVIKESSKWNERPRSPPAESPKGSTVYLVEEPKPVKPIYQPRYEIKDFVLEERSNTKTLEQPTPVESITKSDLLLADEQLQPIKQFYQTRYEIQDPVIEKPSNRNKPERSPQTEIPKQSDMYELEQPKPIKPTHQPRYEMKGFVLNEQPDTKERNQTMPVDTLTKSAVPLVEEHPEPIKPTHQPTYELTDFLLKEKPGTKEPERPKPFETLLQSAVPLVNKESQPFKPTYEPKYKIKDFVLEEQSDKEKPKQSTPDEVIKKSAVPLVEKKTQPLKPTYQPKYEEKEFVLQEQPDKKEPKRPTPVEVVKKSLVPLAEEQPQPIQPTYQPRYEIKDFVLQEQPDKKKPEQPKPVDAEKKSLVPSVEDEPQPIKQAYQPRYEIKDFVLEEQQDKKLPEGPTPAETEKKSIVPLSEEEPQLIKSTYQPTYEIQDLVIKEPSKRNERPRSPPAESPKGSTVYLVEEPKPVKPIYQPRYEIKDFVLEERSDTKTLEQPTPVESITKSDLLLADKQLQPIKQFYQTRYEIQDLVIEKPSNRNKPERSPPTEKPKRSDMYELEQPKPIKPTHQPRYEMKGFVLNEQPDTKERKQTMPVDTQTKSAVPLVEEHPEPIKPTHQPTHELTDFLLKEKLGTKEPERPKPFETLQQSAVPLVNKESQPFKPTYEPRYEIKNFALEEQSDKEKPKQSTPDEVIKKSTVPLVDNKPQPLKLTYQSKYEITDFVLQEQPDKKEPEQPKPVKVVRKSLVPLAEEQPQPIQPTYQPRYEIKDFVLQEQPDKKKPEQPKPIESVKKSLVPSVEEEPQPIRQAYQPRYEIKEFVSEEQPDKKLPERHTPVETLKKSKVPLAEEEPQSIKSTYQTRFEIQDLVINQQSKRNESQRSPPAESPKRSNVYVIEEPKSIKPTYQPRYEIKDFVLEERSDTKTLEQPTPVESITKSDEPLEEEQLQPIKQSNQPRYEIQDLVIEESLNRNKPEWSPQTEIPKRSDMYVLEEPKPIKPTYQPKYEIKDFALEERQDKKKPQQPTPVEVLKKSAVPLVDKEPQPVKPTYQPRYEINDFVLEENPGKKKPKQPAPFEVLKTSAVPLVEDEQQTIKPTYKPRYKIKDLVTEEPSKQKKLQRSLPAESPKPSAVYVPKETKPIKPTYRPRYETKDFVLEEHADKKVPEQPTPVERLKKSAPAAEEEPQPVKPTYQQRYGIKDFVLEELPDENPLPRPTPVEKLKKSAVPLVEEKPQQLKPTYQPRYEMQDLVIKEPTNQEPSNQKEPQLHPPAKTSKRSAEHVVEEQKPIKPTYEARYEVNDFVLEEQSDTKKQEPMPVESITKSDVPLVEEEPQSFKSTYQPRYEIQDLVTEKTSKQKDPQPSPPTETPMRSAVHVVEEPKPIKLTYQPGYEIEDLVLEEQQDKKLSERPTPAETKKKSKVPLAEEEPQPIRLTYQQRYGIQDLVIKEPSKQKEPHRSSPTESPKRSPVCAVKEAKPIKPTYQPRYEIKDFVLEEQPNKKLPKLPMPVETLKRSEVLLVEEEPQPTESTYQPRYEIQDLVIKEPSKRNERPRSPPAESPKGSTVYLVEEPKPVKPIYQPRYEIKDFVLEEQPNKKLPKRPMPVETLKRSEVLLVEEKPQPTESTYQPRYKIQDLVIKERSKQKEPERSSPVESLERSTVYVVEEPEPIKPKYQQRHKIKDFALEEQPDKKVPERPTPVGTLNESQISLAEKEPTYHQRYKMQVLVMKEPSKQEKTQRSPTTETPIRSAVHVAAESKPIKPNHHPRYEIKDYVLEDQPDKKVLKRHKPIETLRKSAVPLPEKEQGPIKPTYQPRYEIQEHAVEETSKQKEPQRSPPIERANRSAAHEVGKRKPVKSAYQPRYEIKDFVLEERSDTKKQDSTLLESLSKSDVPLAEKEPEPIKQTYQPRCETQGLVIEEPSKQKGHTQSPPAESPKRSTGYVIEEPTPIKSTYQPRYEIKDFVLEDQQDTKKQKQPAPVQSQKTSDVPLAQEQPEPIKPTYKARYKRQDLVIEEPSNQTQPERLPAEGHVVEEQKPIKSTYQPRYEMKDFELDEQPDKKHLERPTQVETPKKSEVPLAEEEPQLIKSTYQQRYEIQTLLIEEPSKQKKPQRSPPTETPKRSAVYVIEEPKPIKPTYQPSYEIQGFVLEEHSDTKKQELTPVVSLTKSNEPLAEKQPEPIKPTNKPRYGIQDFVIEERSHHKQRERSPPESSNKLAAYVVEEPKPIKPTYQPRYEIRDLLLEEQPGRKKPEQPKPVETLDKSDISLVQETEPIKSAYRLSCDVNGLVLEDSPKKKETQQPPPVETLNKSVVQLVQEGPESVMLITQPRYEVKEFVLEERPERKDAQLPPPIGTLKKSAVPLKQEKPAPNKVLNERRERKETEQPPPVGTQEKSAETSKKSAVLVIEDPEFIEPTYQSRYEIKHFVLNKYPERKKHKKSPPVEALQKSAVPIAEEPEHISSSYQPRYETKTVVFEKHSKQEEPRQFPPPQSTSVKILQSSAVQLVENFALEEQPERKHTKQPPPIKTPKKPAVFLEAAAESFNLTYTTRNKTKDFVIEEHKNKSESDVADGPKTIQPINQPRYEIRDFLLEEQPEKRETPTIKNLLASKDPAEVTGKPEDIKQKRPKEYETREFKLEEQPERKEFSEAENLNKSVDPTVEEPEFIKPIQQPGYEIRNFIFKEQPETKQIKVSEVSIVKEEKREPVTQTDQTKYEKEEFIFEGQPQRREPPSVKKLNKFDDPVAEIEPETGKQPRHETRRFVLEQQPERKSSLPPLIENLQTIEVSKYENGDFILKEQQEIKVPSPAEKLKKSEVAVVDEPEQKNSVSYAITNVDSGHATIHLLEEIPDHIKRRQGRKSGIQTIVADDNSLREERAIPILKIKNDETPMATDAHLLPESVEHRYERKLENQTVIAQGKLISDKETTHIVSNVDSENGTIGFEDKIPEIQHHVEKTQEKTMRKKETTIRLEDAMPHLEEMKQERKVDIQTIMTEEKPPMRNITTTILNTSDQETALTMGAQVISKHDEPKYETNAEPRPVVLVEKPQYIKKTISVCSINGTVNPTQGSSEQYMLHSKKEGGIVLDKAPLLEIKTTDDLPNKTRGHVIIDEDHLLIPTDQKYIQTLQNKEEQRSLLVSPITSAEIMVTIIEEPEYQRKEEIKNIVAKKISQVQEESSHLRFGGKATHSIETGKDMSQSAEKERQLVNEMFVEKGNLIHAEETTSISRNKDQEDTTTGHVEEIQRPNNAENVRKADVQTSSADNSLQLEQETISIAATKKQQEISVILADEKSEQVIKTSQVHNVDTRIYADDKKQQQEMETAYDYPKPGAEEESEIDIMRENKRNIDLQKQQQQRKGSIIKSTKTVVSDKEIAADIAIPLLESDTVPTLATEEHTINDTPPAEDIWLTVKMKRWESDIRMEKQKTYAPEKQTFLERSTSTVSNNRSFSKSESSTLSTSDESDPWISVRKQNKKDFRGNRILLTQLPGNKSREIASYDLADGVNGFEQNSLKSNGRYLATDEQESPTTDNVAKTKSSTNDESVARPEFGEDLYRLKTQKLIKISPAQRDNIQTEFSSLERSPSNSSAGGTARGTSDYFNEPWIAAKRKNTGNIDNENQQQTFLETKTGIVEGVTAETKQVVENPKPLADSETWPRFFGGEHVPADKMGPGTNVWFTVKMKSWGSNLQKENQVRYTNQDQKTFESSRSTLSNGGSLDEPPSANSSSREHSLASDNSRKSESSFEEPWISVKRRNQSFYNNQTYTTIVSPNHFEDAEKESGKGTESSASSSRILPWIEVRKRNSTKQRFSINKKKKPSDDTIRGRHTTDGEHRLLLLKIPPSVLTQIENEEQMPDTKIEIPWMEFDPSVIEKHGDLPWIKLANQAPGTDGDRLLMLKIPREMILKAFKKSSKQETEILLPWNEVMAYLEETGQIKSDLGIRDKERSSRVSLTFETKTEQINSETQQQSPDMQDLKLILPKKYCLSSSILLKPMINVKEGKNITVRIKKTIKRKQNWKSVFRLNKYDRTKLSRRDEWVILADGTDWWRMQVDDMDNFSKVKPRTDGKQFENIYEITSANKEAEDKINLNQFSQELGRHEKQFSFVIDPKNLFKI